MYSTFALWRVQWYFTIALLGNRTFYLTLRGQNQPIKLSKLSKVLYINNYLNFCQKTNQYSVVHQRWRMMTLVQPNRDHP